MQSKLWIGKLHKFEEIQESFVEDEEPVQLNSQDSFTIPWDQLTPSEIEGMTELGERKIRIFSAGLIQEAGIHLKLPQVTMLTGMSIMNYFYWKRSFQQFEPFHVACASLFIAIKVEETYRRLRDVVSVFYHLLKKKEIYEANLIKPGEARPIIPVLDVSGDFYTLFKQNVIIFETHILKELGFCLYSLSDHPHKYILHFIKNLNGNKNLLQKAWNLLNDAYRTSLVVNYKPNVLACSAIFLAARQLRFPLPKNVNWWELYDTTIEEIQEVCAEILNIYEFGSIKISEVRVILQPFYPVEEIKLDDKGDKDKRDDKKDQRGKHNKRRSKSRSRSRRRDYSRDRRKEKSRSSGSRYNSKRRRRSRSSSEESSSYSKSSSSSRRNYRRRHKKD